MDNLSKEQSLYRFITNEGDFFTDDYLDESFAGKVFDNSFLGKKNKISEDDFAASSDSAATPWGNSAEIKAGIKSAMGKLRDLYGEYKAKIHDPRSEAKGIIKETSLFHGKLLEDILWYRYEVIGGKADNDGHPVPYSEIYYLNGPDDKEKSIVPVRHIIRNKNDASVRMLIMEMQPEIENGAYSPGGLCKQQISGKTPEEESKLPQRYFREQWKDVFKVPEGYHISPSVIRDAISEISHGEKSLRPEYILLLAGPKIYLIKTDVWDQQSYLMLDIDELISGMTASQKSENLFMIFWLLVAAPELLGDTGMIARLIEDNRSHAYSVTSELKTGVVNVIKILGNEASYYFGKHPKSCFCQDFSRTGKEREIFNTAVLNDCLIYVYRLLFIFFAESRKGELGLAPERDDAYDLGYSLEHLRVLALRKLRSRGENEDFFFDNSMKKLFALYGKGSSDLIIKNGYRPEGKGGLTEEWLRRIDSPIFSDAGLTYFKELRIRNSEWQKILKNLSVTRRKSKNGRIRTGLINYAALGVNQLGAVYENLMSYRCYYAEQDLIQVHNSKETNPDLYLLDDYDNLGRYDFKNEVVHDPEDPNRPLIVSKGSFVYWLSTLDRSRSASFYTPVSLTRSTVKYTLQGIRERLDKGEMDYREILDLKIYEPAMGAAAFQNEVIDQLAELYLDCAIKDESRKSDGRKLSPEKYRNELTKVKAFIATRNVYGVDMNPHALELGKLALWLNTIHRGMEPPFFVNRLCVGNAVLGASLTYYNTTQRLKYDEKKQGFVNWWEYRNPPRVEFPAGRVSSNGKRTKGFKRPKAGFYTFLLPTPEMGEGLKIAKTVDITSWKSANKANLDILKIKIADWTKPLKHEDIDRLQTLSKAFDVKLKLYYQYQSELTGISAVISDVWPNFSKVAKQSGAIDLLQGAFRINFNQKIDLLDKLDRDGSPASQVRMVMNYWCALWFWPVDKFAELPDRDQFWSDLEAILAMDDMMTVKKSESSQTSDEWGLLAGTVETTEEFQDYKPHMSFEDLKKLSDEFEEKLDRDFWESPRIRIVKEVSSRKKFCHQELEFLEVFWERGGFDIIAGNPPWVVPSFDVISILSERDPSADVKRIKAPDALKEATEKVKEDPAFNHFYERELLENSRETAFTNINNPEVHGNDLYRIILSRSLKMLSFRGFMGMIHPVSVFTDARGGDFRRLLYPHLKYHFRYANERLIFPEVDHNAIFSANVYRGNADNISITEVAGLYFPEELDLIFRKGTPEHDRLVHFGTSEIQAIRDAFEPDSNPDSPVFVALPDQQTLDVIKKFTEIKERIGDLKPVVSILFNNTTGVQKGSIKYENRQPEAPIELILTGPLITVGNPLFQCPRNPCVKNSDLDAIDLTVITEDYLPRTTLSPALPIPEFRKLSEFADTEMYLKDYPELTQDNKEEIKELQNEELLKHYKISVRAMLDLDSSRTVHISITSPSVSHVNGLKSIFFKDERDTIMVAAEMMSVLYDYFIKSKGSKNYQISTILQSPLFLLSSFKQNIFSRVLLLNCLTVYYRDLWERNFDESFIEDSWSISDERLKPFFSLTREWTSAIPLRNDFERRQALVEIDVLVGMAMGFTLDELCFMYRSKFRVLQQNEADTWYDRKGRIVFTIAQSDVGVERALFEEYQKRAANGETEFVYTVTKNQLYLGRKITYYAPFNKCDRIKDYETAWKHFEKVLGK
ncbi:Eco57I restriction-modification methylase domain-containing protein [Succinimonas amylolytica]|uniref:Eco57I restriction-modification methylase domain-containing protein n=1 Tax=Succinimonas amylolytica TaxID=83769 RepID=UPI00037D573B|nr:hypothetical protein [Succinimonas amylolytica]